MDYDNEPYHPPRQVIEWMKIADEYKAERDAALELLSEARGPTHHHSTDTEPGCKACEWDRRARALLPKETDDGEQDPA